MFPIHTRQILVTSLLAFCSSPLLAQESGVATAAAETTVYENQTSGNGGGYSSVCIGNRGTTGETRRGLVRYTLPEIPPGSTVTRVAYQVVQDRVRSQGAGSPKTATLEVRRVTSEWEEGNQSPQTRACGGGATGDGVNWGSRPSTTSIRATADLTSGGNFTANMDTDNGNANDDLINDVQRWVDGEDNFGWELRVAEEATADNARLVRVPNFTIEWEEVQAFFINAGINDAWFNPLTNGQGFFIIVFPDIPLMFLAWFTYDTERPPEDVVAILGEAGHRWVTGQGGYDPTSDTATVDVFVTAGGVFDSIEPAPDPAEKIGTMTIKWDDCLTATLSYDIPDLALVGEVPLQRIALDNVALCEALLAEGPP